VTIHDLKFAYAMLMGQRKPWFRHQGMMFSEYAAMLDARVERGFRHPKLKPGKNWPRTFVWAMVEVIKSARPKDQKYDYAEIADCQRHLGIRKRWKKITPHHGYLYWRRMK